MNVSITNSQDEKAGTQFVKFLMKFLVKLNFITNSQIRFILISVVLAVAIISCSAILNFFYCWRGDSTSLMVISFLADITMVITGVVASVSNYKLWKLFPDIVLGIRLEQPARKYFLLLLTTFGLCLVMGNMIIELVVERNYLLLSVKLILLVALLILLILIYSHLFLFGCIIAVKTSDIGQLSTMKFKDFSNLLHYFNAKLTEYKLFQKSVSGGLFLIFTSQAVAVTLMIYLTIKCQAIDFSFMMHNLCWCIGVSTILCYFALVCDDAEQLRLSFIDQLW